MIEACQLCGDSIDHWMTMPIDPKKETPCKHGKLFRCRNCSFGMTLPRPPQDEIGTFYRLDNYYTHGKSHFAAPGVRTLIDRLRLRLAWMLDFGEQMDAKMIDQLLPQKSAEICDIGCGSGSLARDLNALGHRVVGVEVDQDAIRQATARGVKVREGTIERLPDAVASRQFDLVIMFNVLEHILDPILAVRAVAKLLKPGGQFICIVPNNASVGLADSGLAWEPLDVPRHLNFFVPANLQTICEHAGLTRQRLFFRCYCRQFTNEWINTERRIYDAIVRTKSSATKNLRQNSRLRAWRLLARTALARAEAKYDQVGIIAQRP